MRSGLHQLPGGVVGVSDYSMHVHGYLAYCRRAKAALEADGSHLDPRYHPTEGGACRLIWHNSAPAEARKIREAFREQQDKQRREGDDKR